MSKRNHKRLRRSLALLGTTMAAMLAIGASSAFASVSLSPAGPYSGSEATTVMVSGTAPTGAEAVAVAVCNTTFSPGTHCDLNSVSKGGAFATVGEYKKGLTIKVRRGKTTTEGWPSFDFTSGVPTETTPPTLCQNTTEAGEGKGTPCAVEVSYYTLAGQPQQIGSESKAISFNP